MKNNFKNAFTLVELLVVITILAIISVVAYQNFGGAVDKAVSGRKINDISTIETALAQYKVDNNAYPSVDVLDSSNNLWGYTGSVIAGGSNSIVVTYDGEEVNTIASASGGGKIYGTGAWASGATQKQIGARGTISRDTLGKKYLSKDLYDPELGDIKVKSTGNKMVDSGVGKYVYATYKKAKGEGPTDGQWTSNFKGVNYNIAFTIKKEGSDTYITKIVGDYDAESCYEDSDKCKDNLIGLVDGEQESGSSNSLNYGIPYAVTDFAQ